VQGVLSIACFILVGIAFWRFGWKIGLLDLLLVIIASNVGLALHKVRLPGQEADTMTADEYDKLPPEEKSISLGAQNVAKSSIGEAWTKCCFTATTSTAPTFSTPVLKTCNQ
jgi:hypothetical protein